MHILYADDVMFDLYLTETEKSVIRRPLANV